MKLAIKLDFHSVINFRTIAITYIVSVGGNYCHQSFFNRKKKRQLWGIECKWSLSGGVLIKRQSVTFKSLANDILSRVFDQRDQPINKSVNQNSRNRKANFYSSYIAS